MLRGAIAGILAGLMATAAHAQSAGGGTAPVAGTGAVEIYTNAELHLTFAYPGELKPVAVTSLVSEGRRMIFGEDTSPDSNHKDTTTCSKVLLAVGSGGAGSTASGTAAGASIALFDVDARCVPAKAFHNKKAMDQLLASLTRQGTTLLGMMPIEEPAFYEIAGHRVRFAAAQGTPVSKSDVQTSQGELLAAVATAVEGHVLAWMLKADDLAMFNRLLASRVDLGTGKPEPLFGGQFQE